MSRVRIYERPEQAELRWGISWSPHQVPTYVGTASEALTAVKARDAALVEQGAGMAVTVIEWEPKTKVGKAVVSVISKG